MKDDRLDRERREYVFYLRAISVTYYVVHALSALTLSAFHEGVQDQYH